jgi:hypothetical protein
VLVSRVPQSEYEVLAQDLREWMRQRAASYKVPTTMRVVTAGDTALNSDRQSLQAAAQGADGGMTRLISGAACG